jgi:hypothetical protein
VLLRADARGHAWAYQNSTMWNGRFRPQLS